MVLLSEAEHLAGPAINCTSEGQERDPCVDDRARPPSRPSRPRAQEPKLGESGEEPTDATLVDFAQPWGSASVPMRKKTSVEVRQPRKCLFRIRDRAPAFRRTSEGLNSQAWLVPSGQRIASLRFDIWPMSLVRLIWSSMKSWGHESSAASNLRRRCDLRARIRARAPTSAARASSCVLPLVSLSSASGRRERVRSPASVTWHEAPWTLSGARQSRAAGLSRNAYRRGSNQGYGRVCVLSVTTSSKHKIQVRQCSR